jgi:hypothetical protein
VSALIVSWLHQKVKTKKKRAKREVEFHEAKFRRDSPLSAAPWRTPFPSRYTFIATGGMKESAREKGEKSGVLLTVHLLPSSLQAPSKLAKQPLFLLLVFRAGEIGECAKLHF